MGTGKKKTVGAWNLVTLEDGLEGMTLRLCALSALLRFPTRHELLHKFGALRNQDGENANQYFAWVTMNSRSSGDVRTV